ncbi:MAG: hypothetical protein L6R28_00915 [Planctomycetes bacterium]|nr:hypothetical protein [Planctomycetota bacterium]
MGTMDPPEDTPPRPAPFQFSLRALVIAVFWLAFCATVAVLVCAKADYSRELPQHEANDREQRALRMAFDAYFSPSGWGERPRYLKKNEFTLQPEYRLNGSAWPVKVIDEEEMRRLADGKPFGPTWSIVQISRKIRKGHYLVHVSFSTGQEKVLVGDYVYGVMWRGKSYEIEFDGDSAKIVESGGWVE